MLSKTEQYVVDNYPYAKKAGETFKMDPLVILAQGAHESAWGTSTLSKKYRNYFGITAGGKKNAYWDGSNVLGSKTYNLYFRVYKTPEDSFMDFARLIATNYAAAHAAAMNYKVYAEKIAASPYISEKNGDNRLVYKNAIISIYEIINQIAKKKDLLPKLPQA
jgi:flagellar protein FlgJ